jgi:hypothetical protein
MNDFDDVFVVVRGIGDRKPLTTLGPFTRYSEDVEDYTGRLEYIVEHNSTDLRRFGLAEISWPLMPDNSRDERLPIHEVKEWIRTVIARVGKLQQKAMGPNLSDEHRRRPTYVDLGLTTEVLEEFVETSFVLGTLFDRVVRVGHVFEYLLPVVEEAGVKIDLTAVLEEFAMHTRVLTGQPQVRRNLIAHFQTRMQQIHETSENARLHIVGHGEGSVLSFLGLLHAFSTAGTSVAAASPSDVLKSDIAPMWLQRTRGFMTLGSPIDFYLLLWPKLFAGFDLNRRFEGHKIKWRNYYDYGDLVGFRLKAVRSWLTTITTNRFFELEDKDDIGFARNIAASRIHEGYFEDAAIFEHFIGDVIDYQKPRSAAVRPRSSIVAYLGGPLIPYLLSLALLGAGSFILNNAFGAHYSDLLDRYVRFMLLGSWLQSHISNPLVKAFGITGLFAGVTLLARLPRLASGLRWFVLGLIAFAVGCLAYSFSDLQIDSQLFALSLFVGLISLVVIMPSHEFGRLKKKPRKKRWMFKGMRPLLLAGVFAIGALVFAQFLPYSALTPQERRLLTPSSAWEIDRAHLNRNDLNMLFYSTSEFNVSRANLAAVTHLLEPHPSVWPELLSGAAFLYLWWLAALIFDFGFVWQRYVRNSVALDRLMDWSGYRE